LERITLNINSSIDNLKGVGPKAKEGLNKCGIYTILDLLLYFPRDYEEIKNIAEGESADANGSKGIIRAVACEIRKDFRSTSGKLVTTVVFKHNKDLIQAKWFNQPYMKNNFKLNEEYQLLGTLKKIKGQNIISTPKIFKGEFEGSRIAPKYSLNKDITANLIAKLINQILNQIKITENLPLYLLNKYRLCSLDEAIRNIHYPTSSERLNEAKRRLKFQELFTYSMKMLMLKDYVKNNQNGIAFKICEELKELKEHLPFELTNAQNRVMREILIDQKRTSSMNRLVQGDVGSGKTIVAVIAMFNIVKNGYQAVMMAPTEILANQHYLEVTKILSGYNLKVALLTGSGSQKEKNRIKEEIKLGNIDIAIGTHALLEDNVEFNKLGIIITDEQHRFGVHQRAKLINKNASADVLVMTATPIPRTLGLYIYGDLDISAIDELPPGRKKIKTEFIEEINKIMAYKLAIREINNGRQVYVVCPLVEENSEMELSSVTKLCEELRENYFQGISVEILHGKMKQKEKDHIMSRFRKDEIKVLVSTTVIEVGVNVPNASVMIIENAERFGLSQLHQLRGRVGRGSYESYCILIGNAKSETTKKRMSIMVESNDGFYIAEQDLKLRGTGEMFGIKQHGDNELILSDIMEDIDILKVAHGEARFLIKSQDINHVKVREDIMNKLELSSRYICFN
jgi:ATP-dependent DNA helicase RecG